MLVSLLWFLHVAAEHALVLFFKKKNKGRGKKKQKCCSRKDLVQT